MINEVEKTIPEPEEVVSTDPPPPSKRNPVAEEWSRKLIEVSNRASVDEEFRKEIAKRIR